MTKPSTAIHSVKGMNDVIPQASEAAFDSAIWDRIFDTARQVLEGYGYRRVWLPVVEETTLFARGIGEATDIVQKEMYTFEDRGGRRLTLRPEGTAGAVRAYVQHNLAQANPVQRWWYTGPMFRAERPQAGRYRQFYQVGAELLGTASPIADAELVALCWRWCATLGLTGITIRLNSLGDEESRAAYRAALTVFLQGQRPDLCESCQERLGTNPLRALDCKRERCRALVANAPDVADSLSPASAQHFGAVEELLHGLGVPYIRDAKLVRGLDYYTGTLFELTTTALGAQDAILGGGRYDELALELGGPPTPAIGFAAGVERIALLLAAGTEQKRGEGVPHLYIVPMKGTEARVLALADAVRSSGPWRVDVDVSGRKLKHQMRRSDRCGARFVLVVGDEEIASGRGRMRDLAARAEYDVELGGAAIAARLAEQLETERT